LLVYWLLFAFFAAGALLTGETPNRRSAPIALLVGAALVWLAIGLRYKVGADWQTYEFLYSYAGVANLGRVLSFGDPGYQLLSWCMRRTGAEIWALNLVCGLIFTWGLYRFARAQPDPWLAFVVAVPYLIVVVAMGYTRQAVAIGILMAGLGSLKRVTSVVRFAVYVAAAALFHRTAVIVLPLVIFAGRRNKFLNAIAGIAGCVLLYDLFLANSVEGFVRTYVEAEYSSLGAAIRVAMNFVPAVLFLLFRKRLRFDEGEAGIWNYFSLASLMMPVLLFVLPSSTAVDRLSLYLIPLQIAVLPRAQYLFQRRGFGRSMIVAYSALVLFIWLNFATHARYWVPYHVYPGLLT
jgi:hypothetical protein